VFIDWAAAMIGGIGLLALVAVDPPPNHGPPFSCTPTAFHIQTVEAECSEGIRVTIWGIKLKPNSLTVTRTVSALPSLMRAQVARLREPYVIEVDHPFPMECYSKGGGKQRISQCFVKDRGIFGGEDLACLLIRTAIAKPQRFTKEYYSMCSGQPRLKRGE
jgi:hypothetical protein